MKEQTPLDDARLARIDTLRAQRSRERDAAILYDAGNTRRQILRAVAVVFVIALIGVFILNLFHFI